MRAIALPVRFIALSFAIVACSPSGSRPGELNDCTGHCSSTLAGGQSSGGDAASSSCTINPADSQCAQCAEAKCCPTLSACSSSKDCVNLDNCQMGCSGSASCVNACQGQYPLGVSALNALASCVESDCAVCNQSGVGDPCFSGGCNPGLSCGTSWCTKACARASDCTGLGPNGANSAGQENACIFTAGVGNTCFPGCGGNGDCAAFPGTYCLLTTSVDSLSVSVCTTQPDSGP